MRPMSLMSQKGGSEVSNFFTEKNAAYANVFLVNSIQTRASYW